MISLPKSLYWHLLAWLVFFAYVVIGDYRLGHTSRLVWWVNGSLMVGCATLFYYCYLLVYPHLLRPKRLWQLALALLLGVLLLTGVRAILEEGLYPLLLGFQNYTLDTNLTTYLFDGFYYTVPTEVVSMALWASEAALRRERENQQLASDKRAADLAFLKMQINPHFLYNTLNMLYGLAYGADKTLAGAILKLSELMRYTLHDTADGLVDLSQEVAYLDNFLDLYRLRYPGRLYATLTVVGNPAGHRVAPLLLIPLVENAFKHGVLDDPATPVQMRLTVLPGVVEFRVENQRHDFQPDASSGIGLVNLRRRLELLYPGQYTWQVGPAGQQFYAHLRLAIPAGANSAATTNPVDSLLAVLVPVTTTLAYAAPGADMNNS